MCSVIWAVTPIAWPSPTIAWSRLPTGRSPFVGAIPLTTTNRNCYRYLSMKFLRRFLLHLLPEGFVRIRHFGFLANRRRATTLPLCFQLLGAHTHMPNKRSPPPVPAIFGACPKCGGPMMVIERLTAAEIQLRSPPTTDAVCRMKLHYQHHETFACLCALPLFRVLPVQTNPFSLLATVILTAPHLSRQPLFFSPG